MLKKQRLQKIIDFLDVHRYGKIDDLALELDVSEITIRRDINELDALNKIKKVHGGASSLDADEGTHDIALNFRQEKHNSEKLSIAKEASVFIKNNMSVYLDAGSTIHGLIPYLKDHDLIVYTHGLHHIDALSQLDIKTYVIGGLLKSDTLASVGGMSLDILSKLSFDVAFMGFNGLDRDFGYSTPDELEASMKRKIIEQSKIVYFLGDASKFDLKTGVSFASYEDGTLISERPFESGFKNL